jgi:hypothetical protein
VRAHPNPARPRDRRDLALVLEHVPAEGPGGGPRSFDAISQSLIAAGTRISPWRLRELLLYLVLSRQVVELGRTRSAARLYARRPAP